MTDPRFDVYYQPHSAGIDWVRQFTPSTALVIGPTSDSIAATLRDLELEARSFDSEGVRRRLHDGVYIFEKNGNWHLVYATLVKPETEAAEDRVLHCDTHLAEGYYAHDDHWAHAVSVVDESPVVIGQMVRCGTPSTWGTVKQVSRTATGHRATVEIGQRLEQFDVADLTVLEGDHRDPCFWLEQGPVTGTELTRTLSWLKLDTPLNDTLYSFAATKTVFKPYQFIPVLKVLSSSGGRILVADEVGLGKTIEAGLIWTELEQRQSIRRALVVVPAALKLKWRQEMERRFMRKLPELKVDDLRDFISDLKADRDPDLVGVVSLESLRTASDVLENLAELNPRFDLVIVDEAHSLRNRSSRSNYVGSLLADLADYLIFLSATPLNLGSNDLFNLVNLLDEGKFPEQAIFEDQIAPNRVLNDVARNMGSLDARSRKQSLKRLEELKQSPQGAALAKRPDYERLREILRKKGEIKPDDIARVKRLVGELNTLGSVLTRTRKIDVPDKRAIRDVEEILVEWTDAERGLYDAIYGYALQSASAKNMPLAFTMQMPLRQACSCLAVAQQRILGREGWAASDEDDALEDVTEWAAADGADDTDPLRVSILRQELPTDSKLSALRLRLRKARQNGMTQALIFSFFKGTVEYLASELGGEFRTAFLHGGVKVDDRAILIDSFRRGEIDILISNQVGSEGLDFEFCNVLVNYDLPWNPMQVEQRIGRLDRFGQKNDKIFIFNMKTPGTIESDIFGRLYDRIGVFERSIGDLEPIMRSTSDELKVILDPNLSKKERDEQIDRYAVATAKEADNIRRLEESNGMLASMSFLDIEGMTESGPISGRYVGAAELKVLLEDTLVRHGASLQTTSDPAVFTIIGTDDLVGSLRDLQSTGGSMHGLGRLRTLLRDGSALTVTFDPHYEAVSTVELITARHPLIQLEVDELRSRRDRIPRFGTLAVATLEPGTSYLVSLDLARTTGGLRPINELWVSALDSKTRTESEEASVALLVGLAEGALLPAIAPRELGRSALSGLLDEVQDIALRRLTKERLERKQENDALVQARIASEKKSIALKLARVEKRGSETDPRMLRMLNAQQGNLERDLADIDRKYDQKRDLALSVEHVALVLLTGPIR